MEKYYKKIIGTLVVASHGEIVGLVSDIILDPDTGKIIAFNVMPGINKIIVPMDILNWGIKITVNDKEDIIDMEEVINVNTIYKKKIRIMGQKVYTKSGEYMGKVLDYAVNEYSLSSLTIGSTFLYLFFWNKKIITKKNIIEIKKNKIIIKDPIKPIKIGKLKVDIAAT